MRRHYDYYDWYEPSSPKAVKGGIKAQSKRGSFSEKWWSKLWIQALENFGVGARLARGRTYARLGQVADLDIGKGVVCAKVQGSRSEAYRISIKLTTFTEKQWQDIVSQIIEKPILAAQLISNEMPHGIESVFKKVGQSLFPQNQKDLETDCTCPDWSNPCKHIAAVFYLMAEAFDKDPFLIFKLRGMEREEFLNSLQASGAARGESGDNIGQEAEDPAGDRAAGAVVDKEAGGTIVGRAGGTVVDRAAGAVVDKAGRTIVDKAGGTVVDKAGGIVVDKAGRTVGDKAERTIVDKAGGTVVDKAGVIIVKRPETDPEPLPLDCSEFWGGGNSATAFPSSSATSISLHAVLIKRLGSLALWRSDKSFIGEMDRIYKNASVYVEGCIISYSDFSDK